LGLLHDLVPKAVRIAVLVNPANASTAEATLRDIPEAARAIGLQIQVLNASTSKQIEAAFATVLRDRADALFVTPTHFSLAGASNSRHSRRATGFPPLMFPAKLSKLEG
jgi:putative ABC transport system substrate-binding protein